MAARTRLLPVVAGLFLAVQVAIVDRWPDVVARDRVWRVGRFDEAFAHRWEDRPLPPQSQVWLDRWTTLHQSPVLSAVRRQRRRRAYDRVRQIRLSDPLNLDAINLGPGKRVKNSLFVAAAVDATWAGAPATALGWDLPDEPTSPFGRAARAKTVVEAKRIVEAWGPGGKGIVSLRDPGHPARRYFNVRNVAGVVEFADYSAPDDPRSAPDRARSHLASIDERFGFPSILVWRLANLDDESQIPANFFAQSREQAESQLGALWGSAMPEAAREAALRHIWFQRDLTHARWLTRAIQRGACTLLPDYLTDLATGAQLLDQHAPEALTQTDSVLLELLATGRSQMHDGTIEVTVAETSRVHELLACIPDALVRRSPVDGLADATIEICIDHQCRQRLRSSNPTYQPPLTGAMAETVSPPRRTHSWLDTNRGGGNGTRKTNCWNTAAAIASYLATGAPNSSLPIYRHAPLRPTIPEYLAMVGATGSTRFVTSKAEADTIVRSWGPHGQGIVAAAHSAISTHMFNAYCEADGITVRYLDGHTSEEGDFNFGVSWMRIGIVQLTAPRAAALGCEAVVASSSG